MPHPEALDSPLFLLSGPLDGLLPSLVQFDFTGIFAHGVSGVMQTLYAAARRIQDGVFAVVFVGRSLQRLKSHSIGGLRLICCGLWDLEPERSGWSHRGTACYISVGG